MDENNTTLGPKTYCISIDGSKFSDYGFEVASQELYKKGDRIIVCHISNPDKLESIPYEAQPKTISMKYNTICSGMFKFGDYEVTIEEREKGSSHALETLKKIAEKKQANVIVMGYIGHKSTTTKKELTKGLIYALKYIKMPIMVIKERTLRVNKENNSITWLFSIVSRYSRSYKAFEMALPYIDPNKDKVIGINLYRNGDGWDKKEIETDFLKKCGGNQIKTASFKYYEQSKEVSIGKQISDIINFGDEYIDFVCMGHHAEKYDDLEKAPTVEIIKTAQVNIFFSPLSGK